MSKFIPGNPQVYTHHIDLNERGHYRIHVENQNGKVVFSANNEGENGWPAESYWMTEDGFMKHTADMDGLADYLKSHGIMPANATLIDKK